MPVANNSGDWSATLHSDTLNVHGQFTFPTPGYIVNLKKKEPQGMDPAILLLEKTVIPPTRNEPNNRVSALVSFEEHTNPHYHEVEILPDRIRIKVRHN